MEKIKAILIVRIPARLGTQSVKGLHPMLKEMAEMVGEDYHTIAVLSTAEDFQFEGVYPQDFKEEEFNKLKKRLEAEFNGRTV